MKRKLVRWTVALTFVLLAQTGLNSGSIPAFAAEEANQDKPAQIQPGIGALPEDFKTRDDLTSYAVGIETGRIFKRQGMQINPDFFLRGMKEGIGGEKLLISEDQLEKTLMAYMSELRIKRGTNRMLTGDENKKEGEAFLAGNKNQKGVITLPSGLQYKIIKTGKGQKPGPADTVEVNARGTLVDGTEFFNTQNSGPATLLMGDALNVIPGVREALKLMPTGSKWQLFIPHDLAYGQRGSGKIIGPYSTLVYEIELVKIK